MNRYKKTRIVAWLLIFIGLAIFVTLSVYYYDTPFGYGNYDGLMVALFAPVGAIPLVVGLAILAFIRWRKHQT